MKILIGREYLSVEKVLKISDKSNNIEIGSCDIHDSQNGIEVGCENAVDQTNKGFAAETSNVAVANNLVYDN